VVWLIVFAVLAGPILVWLVVLASSVRAGIYPWTFT
jgi:hypothetical protein